MNLQEIPEPYLTVIKYILVVVIYSQALSIIKYLFK